MTSLEDRLERLEALLQVKVRLSEPEPETFHPTLETESYEEESKPRLVINGGCAEVSSWAARRDDEGKDEGKDEEKRQRAMRQKLAFDCSTFRVGEPLDEKATFCPWKLVKHYPYHFIGKTNRPLAKPFFDDILFGNTWDFFYLHDPSEPAQDPYLAVPTGQFEAFLDMINTELGIALRIPDNNHHQPQEKFFLKFGQGDTPQPRYLCRSTDGTSLDVRPWPEINHTDIERFNEATVQMQDDLKVKLKLLKTGMGRKSDKDRAARSKMKQDERIMMLQRAQTYLGIRGEPFAQDIVFLCVDIEAIELPPNPISEIGLAILSTKDTREMDPGSRGENWWSMIDCHHLRVKEYSGLRNSRYVAGCPDAFDFGESIIPPKADVFQEVMDILNPHVTNTNSIVLVGHDLQQDLQWMSDLGIDLVALRNNIGQLDTKDMYQGWREEPNARGLGKVLAALDIPSKNLHNAGNDAYYTVCAMLGIAVEEKREGESKNKENETDQLNVGKLSLDGGKDCA